MSKKIIFIFISFSWIIIAAGMVFMKQYTMNTGRVVLLETVPVDPRDFLRGDYVVLNYKISSIDLKSVQSEKEYYGWDEKVYVKLAPRNGFWEAVAVQTRKCLSKDDVCIKGKVKYSRKGKADIVYGLESYFVPEGEGRIIEENMRGQKTSVAVEAVVDASGNALIKSVFVDKNN